MKIPDVLGRYIDSVEKHPVIWGVGAAAVAAVTIGVVEGFAAFQDALAPNVPAINLDVVNG